MSFGLTFEKLLIVAVLLLLLIGPERLPGYASKLAQWARKARDYVDGARDRVRDELGPELDDIDWKQLDPRQYDPRRIIREALTAPPQPVATSAMRESARPGRPNEAPEVDKAHKVDESADRAIPLEPDPT